MSKQKYTNIITDSRKVKLAELLADPEDKRSKKAKIEEAGVTRKTAYAWFKDPEYISYIESLVDTYTDAHLADVWRSLTKQCIRGDVSAMKLFFELKGRYRQKVEHTGKDGGPIEVTSPREQLASRIASLASRNGTGEDSK